jgi:hypothetical protein
MRGFSVPTTERVKLTMKGWSLQICAVGLLSIGAVAGCSGDRRSAAATPGDTSAAGASDTASRSRADTTTTAPDTGRRQDTAASSTQSPPVPRAAPAKKPGVKPNATPRPSTPAATRAGDTAARAAAQPSDTPPGAGSSPDQANAPLRDPYHQAPLDTVSETVYTGWKQFNLNCARCHGEDVQGTTIAPHLLVSLRPSGPINTKEIFMQTVCGGRPAKGMPSWCALGMDMPTIESIYSYVKGRSDGKIHPGRPARKQAG